MIRKTKEFIEHFAQGLRSTPGKSLEEQLFEASFYREANLGNVLRAVFSGIANNPSKSMVFLVTDYQGREAKDIAKEVNSYCLQVGSRSKDIKPVGKIISGYFENAILKLSNFSHKTGQREQMETKLGKKEIDPCSKRVYYSKTLDGFLLGDPFAYLGICQSSLPELKVSTCEIYGQASSTGETNPPTTAILLLDWLGSRKGIGRDVDFITGVFGLEKPSRDEYHKMLKRISDNLVRLDQAGIVIYERKAPEEEIVYKATDKYLLLNPGAKATNIRRVLEAIREGHNTNREGHNTNKKVAEKTGISENRVRCMTKSLRDLGYLEVVSGKSMREYSEFSEIQLLPAGYKVLETLEPALKLIGFYDAQLKHEGKYSMLSETVTPDFKGLLKYRDKLDSVLGNEYRNFVEMCREARLRQQGERQKKS